MRLQAPAIPAKLSFCLGKARKLQLDCINNGTIAVLVYNTPGVAPSVVPSASQDPVGDWQAFEEPSASPAVLPTVNEQKAPGAYQDWQAFGEPPPLEPAQSAPQPKLASAGPIMKELPSVSGFATAHCAYGMVLVKGLYFPQASCFALGRFS